MQNCELLSVGRILFIDITPRRESENVHYTVYFKDIRNLGIGKDVVGMVPKIEYNYVLLEKAKKQVNNVGII